MKIIFEIFKNYKNDYGDCKIKFDGNKTYTDIGYYYENDIIYFYYSKSRAYHVKEKIYLLNIIKSSCELKWCLLHYKDNFIFNVSNIISISVEKMLHMFLEDRIKISESVLEFEVIERD